MSAVDTFYGLYRRSPIFFQNLMVTGYGWVLHRRRYGAEHERVFSFLMESLRWDRERLKAHELERLKECLDHAARHVPHYRELWSRIGFDPRDVRTRKDLEQLPVTEKEEVRSEPARFVSEAFRGKLYRGSTSGTTGKPLSTAKDRGCYQRTWAFQDRQRRIWGITGKGPRVSIGVRPVVPTGETRPPFWRHDRTEDNWLFSNFHISPAALDDYVQKVAEIGPEEINAYPSGAYLLASRALRAGERRIRPVAVVSCAETVLEDQRRVIEEAFHCRVADQYGASEVCFWVGQCPHGTYHINHEFGILESLRGDQPVTGEPGDAVGTGFVNRAQYLIRYRLGDSVVLPAEHPRCPCGWDTDRVEQIIGRIDDVLYTPEGRALGRLDIVLKAVEGVREAQLVQDGRDHLTVNFVPEGGRAEPAEVVVRQRLENYFGPAMRVDFRWVESIPRTHAGKFRYQLNLVGAPAAQSAQRVGRSGE